MKIKISKETLIYLIMAVLIFAFIMFLPQVYDFMNSLF